MRHRTELLGISSAAREGAASGRGFVAALAWLLAFWLVAAVLFAPTSFAAGPADTENVAAPGVAPAAASSGRTAVVIRIDGVIGPATSDFVRRGLDEAAEREAAVAVLSMDTPGGLDTSMREIIRAILSAPMPVLAYVSPSGARAASAGTYIMYASHVAAMAPGTNLGAATPVAIGGGGLPGIGGDDERDRGRAPPERDRRGSGESAPAGKGGESGRGDDARRAGDDGAGDRDARGASPKTAMEKKAVNDAVAYIRSLAQMRGRNAEWAESAVREGVSLSADEAAERGVIDFVAVDLDQALQKAHGRKVMVGKREVQVDSRELTIERIEPDWRTRLLTVLTNPNLALILMMIGVYGLIFEFMNPGSLYPGTIGAICLLVGLYALTALPLNYAGFALMILGVALMIAEAFVPSVGILGIGGAIAFMLGATILVDIDIPGFEISRSLIAGIGVTTLAFVLIAARAAVRSFRHRAQTGVEGMLGTIATVLDWNVHAGHVHAHGERWAATSDTTLAPGELVRIVGRDGLRLHVQPESSTRTT